MGKTTFGKLLAKKLNCGFIDTDRLIEETYQLSRKQKLTCHEIFQEVGPVHFRALEYEVIQSLQDVRRSVIAAGGGVMLLHENVEALQKNSLLIYLFCEKDKLKKRVFSEDPLPAFLDAKDPDSSFDRMFDERDEAYRKIGGEIIDVTELSEGDVLSKICALIGSHGEQ